MGSVIKNNGLYLIMLTSLTISMSLNAVMPIQPLLIIEVGATNVELGLILACSSMVALASRIPLSILAERIGRRIMIIIASIVQFTSLISFAFVNDVIWFYPLMILQSMIWGLFGPSVISFVSDMASSERIGSLMGIYYTSIGLGQFIGPFLSSILTNYMSLRQMFLVLSILPILGLLFTLKIKSTVNIEKGFVGKEIPVKKRGIMNSFKKILRSRNVIGLCLSRVAFSFSVGIIATLLSVWAKTELKFTTSIISILFSARGATNTLIRIPIGRITDKIENKKPILLAFSLGAIAFLIFSVSTDFTFILVAMCIYGLAWGMRIVPDTAILVNSVGSEDKGLALAILMSMFGVGRSVGSYFAGATYTILSMNLIFQISAAVLILGVIILAVSIKNKEG